MSFTNSCHSIDKGIFPGVENAVAGCSVNLTRWKGQVLRLAVHAAAPTKQWTQTTVSFVLKRGGDVYLR